MISLDIGRHKGFASLSQIQKVYFFSKLGVDVMKRRLNFLGTTVGSGIGPIGACSEECWSLSFDKKKKSDTRACSSEAATKTA